MQVSYTVSLINRVLVQDRILYDLHNTRELMIMQMREKRESSKREVKSDTAGNRADLEITERCRQDFGGVFDLISNLLIHRTRQGPPERFQNKTDTGCYTEGSIRFVVLHIVLD